MTRLTAGFFLCGDKQWKILHFFSFVSINKRCFRIRKSENKKNYESKLDFCKNFSYNIIVKNGISRFLELIYEKRQLIDCLFVAVGTQLEEKFMFFTPFVIYL